MCRIEQIFCLFDSIGKNSALSSTSMCRKCHVLVNTTEGNHCFGLVYACSISGILNYTEHGYGTVEVSSESVHDLGVG